MEKKHLLLQKITDRGAKTTDLQAKLWPDSDSKPQMWSNRLNGDTNLWRLSEIRKLKEELDLSAEEVCELWID